MALLIADIGSTHMGDKANVLDAIDIAKEIGVDVIKFQLFKGIRFTGNGNIELPYEWWPHICEYAESKGQRIATSVFDKHALDLVLKTSRKYPLDFVKFAFSQKYRTEWIHTALAESVKVIISCDVMTLPALKAQFFTPAVRFLYCIPEYPVKYDVNFDQIFPRFDGFSDHTLGIEQTVAAVNAGAKIIEKHMTLVGDDIECPDKYFAIEPQEMQELAKWIEGFQQ